MSGVSSGNTGTAEARNIELSSTPPSGWKVTFEPKTVASVPPLGESKFEAIVVPSEKAVGPGADAGAALKISPAVAQVTGFPVARVESEGVTPAAVRDDARLFVYQGMTDLSFTGRGSISFAVPLTS